jgi:hypothetical protein
MFVPSSQTRSPSLKVWEVEGVLDCFITSAATFRAAVTSDHTWSRVRRHSSTVGILEVKFTGGMNSGWNPYQISKGECPVALCCQALCANSMKGIRSTQLSC